MLEKWNTATLKRYLEDVYPTFLLHMSRNCICDMGEGGGENMQKGP